MKQIAILLTVCVLAVGVHAQSTKYTPKPGDSLRKAILDTLRVPVEKELNQKVVFKIDRLNVSGNWAFVRGVPQRPDGGAVDYRGTPYADAIEAGVFDDWFCALLRRQRGSWHVVTYAIGATDVVWEGWDDEFGAPNTIFE